MDYKQQQFKAIISNHGEETLYQSLSGEIERRLPAVPVSWRRSFGRPSKEVSLQAIFMKFDSVQLSSGAEASTVASKPLLHIFWTSCLDGDKYKSNVKGQIAKWQKLLNESKCSNWLIVHVVYQDNSKLNKSKINLPRSSVYDKIKTEFSQKVQDRCIQLWEPDKETLFTKSGESWDALLSHLRNLLLESFGRNLDSFEDRVRVTREKYADPDWSFLDYFLVHEELALTYQSITLREEALIQYDEVDALLSQFIINCSGRELPRWLQMFCSVPTNWDGVSVSAQNMDTYKELIKSGNASLIDFRNYLFARQCKLLTLMNRKYEIPPRLMEFVYMVIQEIKLLNIRMQVGSVACWTVLTSMQLYQLLETVEQKDNEFQSTFAHMYDYMRQKFHYLGHITGLFYNREQTRDERDLSTLLVAGFGKYPSRKKEMPSAIKLLKVALSSKDAYETLYLEISSKTIQLMTNLNRHHFGMYVGVDLAKFHLQYGRYNEAEVLLEKAWSIYKQQRWEFLYTDVLIPLADCQLKRDSNNLSNRYINSVTLLACANCLPFDMRHYYSNELLRLSTDKTIKLPVIGLEPVIKIKNIHINLVKNKGHIGDSVQATFDLTNELTVDLPCKSIYIVLKHGDLSNPKSFSDNSSLPHRPSSFSDHPNSGISVSLSEEKPIEVPKESLTPSNILKKLKGHRRTWSRNITDSKNNSQTNSVNTSPSALRSTSATSINTYPDDDASSAKKALFTDKDENKNEQLDFFDSHFEKSSSLPNLNIANGDSDIKISDSNRQHGESDIDLISTEKPLENTDGKIMGPIGENSLSVEKLDVILGKPLATSSMTETFNEIVTSKNESVNQDKDENVASSSITDDDIFEPELEEEEQNFDQILVSAENFILTPGFNSVELKSEINIEGKFDLHCVNCVIGNLTFYKLLTHLPKNVQSFYMVADPPKVVWTTDYLGNCLLTASRQRLYVTLLNGPGLISDGSILQISSYTGLRFEDLSSSDIEIYPLERDGSPRNEVISVVAHNDGEGNTALLYMPECKPYERVSIYFDIIAPARVKTSDNHLSQHGITFSCLWLKHLVESSVLLHCMFCEPFQMDYEVAQKGSYIFVRVVLHAVNPIPLILDSPKLTSSQVSFELVSNNNFSIHGYEDCNILWKLDSSQMSPASNCENLLCQFGITFRNDNSNELDSGYFSKPINITYTKYLYSVDVSFSMAGLKASEACSATVTITKLFLGNASYRLFLILNTEMEVWNYVNPSDRYHEVTFDDNASGERFIVIDILSNKVGSITAPVFILAKLNTIDVEIGDNEEVDILDNIKSFEYGQVNYRHSGQNFLYKEDTVVTSVS